MATIQEIGRWLATDPNAAKKYHQVRAQQTPEVQAYMDEVRRDYDFTRTGGGKLTPFSKPITPQQVCDYYGMDPKVSERVFQTLVDTALTQGLQDRMGTDADRPVPEPTLRDHVEAALNIHQLDSHPGD